MQFLRSSLRIHSWSINLVATLILLMTASVSSANERLEEIFGEGVFETKWGDSLALVQEAHPDGKYKSASNMHFYTVKSSRKVLGIDRKNKGITFNFAEPESGLKSVAVKIGNSNDYTTALFALRNLFGDGTKGLENAAKYVPVSWASDDATLKVEIYMAGIFGVSTYVTISKLVTSDDTKEDLGF